MNRIAILLSLLVLTCPAMSAVEQQQDHKELTQQQQIPVAAFSRLPMHQNAKLSPDGTQVAFVYNFLSPDRSVLTVLNADTGSVSYLLETDNIGQKLRWFDWANNKTLVGGVVFAGSRGGNDTKETRLFSVDVVDPEMRYLVKPRMNVYSREFKSQIQDNVLDMLPDDPEHILVALDLDRPIEPSVFKINIYTNRKKRVMRNRHETRRWMTDGQGQVRLAISQDFEHGDRKIEWLNDKEEWITLFEYDGFGDTVIEPIGFGSEKHILYYRAYDDDRKKLFSINTRDQKTSEVFSDPDYDFNGRLIYSKNDNKVLGIRYADEGRKNVYWDEDRIKFQSLVDKAIPGNNNFIVDLSDDENRYIVYSERDNLPGAYYLGDRKLKKLQPLLQSYPGLTTDHFNEHQQVTFKTRDNMDIEGLLTLPKTGKAPYPTVIHPHGGPGSRDIAGFDIWTAYFNSRGYAVFRPNFRGSAGYGQSFAENRYQGWGMAMQDDITDGTQWLISEKIADPTKICIVGASYGGYAAMMGAVKTPDLYQCVVSLGGVMDLPYMVQKSLKYTSKNFVKKHLGTESKDLENRSPAYHAEKIKVPVLLVHGEDDRVVDVTNSRNMRKALEGANKQVEYLELEQGDHYLSIQANRHAFFNKMDAFLREYLTE